MQRVAGAHAICPETSDAQQPLAHCDELVHVAAQVAVVPSFTQTAPAQHTADEQEPLGGAHGLLADAHTDAGAHALLPEVRDAQQPLTQSEALAHVAAQRSDVPLLMQIAPVQQLVEVQEPLGEAHGQAVPVTQTLAPVVSGTQHPPAHWDASVQVAAQ